MSEGDSAPLPERRPDDAARDDAESISGDIAGEEPAFTQLEKVELVVTQHTGPVPSKEWLESVEALRPGATDLILTDYAAQRAHEREMEKASLELDSENLRLFARYQTLRLAIAGAVVVLITTAAIVLISVGKPITGFALVVGELAALVTAFLATRDDGEEDDEEDENE